MSKLDEIIERNSYLTAKAVFELADDDGITLTVKDLKELKPYIELAELYLGYINSGEIVYCLTEEDETRAIELYNKIKEQGNGQG